MLSLPNAARAVHNCRRVRGAPRSVREKCARAIRTMNGTIGMSSRRDGRARYIAANETGQALPYICQFMNCAHRSSASVEQICVLFTEHIHIDSNYDPAQDSEAQMRRERVHFQNHPRSRSPIMPPPGRPCHHQTRGVATAYAARARSRIRWRGRVQ